MNEDESDTGRTSVQMPSMSHQGGEGVVGEHDEQEDNFEVKEARYLIKVFPVRPQVTSTRGFG